MLLLCVRGSWELLLWVKRSQGQHHLPVQQPEPPLVLQPQDGNSHTPGSKVNTREDAFYGTQECPLSQTRRFSTLV